MSKSIITEIKVHNVDIQQCTERQKNDKLLSKLDYDWYGDTSTASMPPFLSVLQSRKKSPRSSRNA